MKNKKNKNNKRMKIQTINVAQNSRQLIQSSYLPSILSVQITKTANKDLTGYTLQGLALEAKDLFKNTTLKITNVDTNTTTCNEVDILLYALSSQDEKSYVSINWQFISTTTSICTLRFRVALSRGHINQNHTFEFNTDSQVTGNLYGLSFAKSDSQSVFYNYFEITGKTNHTIPLTGTKRLLFDNQDSTLERITYQLINGSNDEQTYDEISITQQSIDENVANIIADYMPANTSRGGICSISDFGLAYVDNFESLLDSVKFQMPTSYVLKYLTVQ